MKGPIIMPCVLISYLDCPKLDAKIKLIPTQTIIISTSGPGGGGGGGAPGPEGGAGAPEPFERPFLAMNHCSKRAISFSSILSSRFDMSLSCKSFSRSVTKIWIGYNVVTYIITYKNY